MKTVINIKTEKEVKIDAQKLAKEMGFSLSALINAYLKQFLRNKEVYFSSASKMSPKIEDLLGKIEFDIQRDRNVSPSFSSKKELGEYLTSL
jgi:antitoxin component of RelBE/YafQ-DinJ toxin-antitoxin module